MTGTPPSTQGDPASFTVSVGLATAGLYDIDHFIYTTDGSEPDPQTSPSVPATPKADQSGATASLTVTALNSLQNYIHVRAVNRTGTPSLHDATCVAGLTLDAPSCSYNVPNAVTPSTGLVGAWGFDEGGGRAVSDSVALTPGNAGVPTHMGTMIGGGDWRPGHDYGTPWSHPDTNGYAQGMSGSLMFDGSTSYVTTGASVADTSQSFSVSAWVYLVQTGDYRTAVRWATPAGVRSTSSMPKDIDRDSLSLCPATTRPPLAYTGRPRLVRHSSMPGPILSAHMTPQPAPSVVCGRCAAAGGRRQGVALQRQPDNWRCRWRHAGLLRG